jgi:hypothetical protein
MPGGMYYHAMTSIPALGKVYSLGGYNNAYLSVMYEYDVATNAWTTKNPISDGAAVQPRYGPAAFAVGTRVYVVGGYNNNYMQTTLEFNALTNTWAQRANMAYQRYLHSATAFNGKGYTYGGIPQYTYGEEYTPPDFGLPPNVPTAVAQTGSSAASSLQAQVDPTIPDGWTNNQITFSANVTDPDLISGQPQQVRFRVQVKAASASWTQASAVTSLATPLAAQGVQSLSYNIAADGSYDWRWRVEDTFGNSYPLLPNAWVEAFGTEAAPNTNSPDFRSDQLPPSDPIADAPNNVDIASPTPGSGPVVLSWIESTDNGPVSGISYELQVAREGGFNDIEAQLFSTAGTSSYPVTLTVARDNKFWRIRAKDIGGNLSNWSASKTFRVVYDDGFDHASGDAKKGCGFTAGATPILSAALMGLALLLGAGRRVSRRV